MAENIWEYIFGDDVAEAMRLAGCDEKYISGNASDFEKFRELIAALALFDGCTAMEKCCKKIGVAIGEKLSLSKIEEYSASLFWQKYASLNSSVFEEKSVKNCVEKNNYKPTRRHVENTVDYLNKSTDIFSFCGLLDGASGRKAKNEEKLEKPIVVHFFDGDFNRPDRYSAERVLKKIVLDENCNNDEKNILLCQLVCEVIYDKKYNCPILIFDIKNGSECAEGLIKYLVKRSLEARIYLLTDQSVTPQDVRKICLCGNSKCFVTPVFLEIDLEYLNELVRIYPRDLIIHK